MSLLAEIEAQSSRKGPPCMVGVLLTELDGADRDDLVAALTKPTITSAAIGRALRKLGHSVNDHSVVRHRAGNCLCQR